MILDSSAIVAVARDEPEAAHFVRLIESSPSVALSAGTWLETAIVLGAAGEVLLDELANGEVEVLPFDEAQARIAWRAYRRFGRGSGSAAQLNLGDCFSYALSAQMRRPLLFTGDHFPHTDVELAG